MLTIVNREVSDRLIHLDNRLYVVFVAVYERLVTHST